MGTPVMNRSPMALQQALATFKHHLQTGPVYPWVLVGLLSFNFGVVYFDRNTLNFLMPLIQPELHLSNKQIGLLGSVLGASWAIAGFGIGRLSDATGQRKLLLVVCALV